MKKNIIIRLILASMSIALLVLLYFTFIKTKSTENVRHKFVTDAIPEIKEDFKNTEFKSIKKYNYPIIVNSKTNEITTYDKDIKADIIIGKFGSIYNNPIIPEKDKDGNVGELYGNYLAVCDDDNRFSFTNTKTGQKSSYYKCINSSYNNQLVYMSNGNISSEYLILDDGDKIILFNYNNGKSITLNSKIKEVKIYNHNETLKNDNNYINYIIAKDENNKYGLIDYNGNTKLEFKYDRLENYINKDEYLACLNNKCGLIDSNDKILLNLEYDNIIYNQEYKVLLNNNTASVMYLNKMVVSSILPYNNLKEDSIKLIYNKGLLYYINKANYEENTQVFWDNSKTYLIGNAGVIKRYDGYLEPVYDYNNEKLLYFYNIYKGNQRYGITFYDTDLYEYYATYVSYDINYDYYVNINKISDNKNYYKITINDYNGHINYYYVDLFNSKMVKDKTAYYTYFNNGYAFTLINDKLIIYKKDEIIDEYDNIKSYLGSYYFVRYEDNKYEIVELKFNKNDSNK